MRRLSQKNIEAITSMAKRGQSLNSISNELSIGKTTVYYWFVKAVGKKIKPIEINRSNEFDIGQFVGAFAGDGNFYFDKKCNRYRVSFYTGSYEEEYAFKLNELIFDLFGKKAKMRRRGNVILNVVYRKKIFDFIKEYLVWEKTKGFTVRLKENPLNYSNDFLKGFVRGLFDTDGNVNRGKAQLMLGSISTRIISQVSEILKIFCLDHNICVFRRKLNRKPLNCIYVYGKSNLQKFNKIVGSSNPYERKIIQKVMR